MSTLVVSADGSGSTAALIAVAGLAMILATAGLIYVVVRRKPAAPANASAAQTTAEAVPVEEPDAAPAS